MPTSDLRIDDFQVQKSDSSSMDSVVDPISCFTHQGYIMNNLLKEDICIFLEWIWMLWIFFVYYFSLFKDNVLFEYNMVISNDELRDWWSRWYRKFEGYRAYDNPLWNAM